MNQPEMRVHSEKVEIVDPHHLCPEGVNDLLVHDLFPEKDEILLWKEGIHRVEAGLGKGDPWLYLSDALPREIKLLASDLNDDTNNHGIRLSSLGEQVRNPARLLSRRVMNLPVQEMAEKIKVFEVRIHDSSNSNILISFR